MGIGAQAEPEYKVAEKVSTPEIISFDDALAFSANGVEVLKLAGNGDIYVNGRLVENDKEVVDGMRKLLEKSSS